MVLEEEGDEKGGCREVEGQIVDGKKNKRVKGKKSSKEKKK